VEHNVVGTPDPVVVGRIIRPHGNRGQVVVAPETDFGDRRFQPGAALTGAAPDRTLALIVTSSRPHDHRWVLGFEGFASIDDAETLRGVELQIPEEALIELPAGQYYLHDLVGCQVETETGTTVGPVVRVDPGGGPTLLVVGSERGEILIPFADSICRRIDVAAKCIVIAPPAGLLEVNASTREAGIG
jgi:16S rRNA processing protein RimM